MKRQGELEENEQGEDSGEDEEPDKDFNLNDVLRLGGTKVTNAFT